MFSYGFKGFFTGASIGLAAGYLSTGSSYESHEWKNLVMGAGIGAIVGVGAGVGLALADIGAPGRGTGWYVLRDTDLGTFLGAFTGAAVGALVWVDDGRAKDVLIGLSFGALIGAGVGSRVRHRRRAERSAQRTRARRRVPIRTRHPPVAQRRASARPGAAPTLAVGRARSLLDHASRPADARAARVSAPRADAASRTTAPRDSRAASARRAPRSGRCA